MKDDNLIKALREEVGLTQAEFSEKYGIPIGTLRNWEQNKSNPPDYVYTMIFKIMEKDFMIVNTETLKILGIMKELAKKSKNGIFDFKDAHQDDWNKKLFYDKRTGNEKEGYRIVCDACVIDDRRGYHHDAISYWDDLGKGFSIRAKEYDGEYQIDVTFSNSNLFFTIENGDWYCTDYGV